MREGGGGQGTGSDAREGDGSRKCGSGRNGDRAVGDHARVRQAALEEVDQAAHGVGGQRRAVRPVQFYDCVDVLHHEGRGDLREEIGRRRRDRPDPYFFRGLRHSRVGMRTSW